MTFEEWFADRVPGLLRFATVLSGSPTQGEDLVQDVAIKVHAQWSRLSRLDHLDAYVRRMLVNRNISVWRRWSRTGPRAELTDQTVTGDGADFADDHAERAQLLGELGRLPARQRAVLVLRYYEGLDDAEIADVLGCRPGTVRGYASRALASLRIELTDTTHTQEVGHAH